MLQQTPVFPSPYAAASCEVVQLSDNRFSTAVLLPTASVDGPKLRLGMLRLSNASRVSDAVLLSLWARLQPEPSAQHDESPAGEREAAGASPEARRKSLILNDLRN